MKDSKKDIDVPIVFSVLWGLASLALVAVAAVGLVLGDKETVSETLVTCAIISIMRICFDLLFFNEQNY